MKRVIPRLEGAARAVARGELVGRRVRVAASTDPTLVGVEGVVVDETLRTFVVRRDGGRESRIGKRGTTFAFREGGQDALVPGAAIEFRSEDRTKKVK